MTPVLVVVSLDKFSTFLFTNSWELSFISLRYPITVHLIDVTGQKMCEFCLKDGN